MQKTEFDLIKNKFNWPISRKLLFCIINDQVSDLFVCELIWDRLYYVKQTSSNVWISGKDTPSYWSEKFNIAPNFISERPASIHLTRSIPKNYKQGLKQFLDFKGYKINELYPRRTRRATAVNWLIYWIMKYNNEIKDSDRLPNLSSPPKNPINGHPGDPDIK